MKPTHLLKRTLLAFSLAISAVIYSQLSVKAEAINAAIDPTAEPAQTTASLTEQNLEVIEQVVVPDSVAESASAIRQAVNTFAPASEATVQLTTIQFDQAASPTPTPGTADTSASALLQTPADAPATSNTSDIVSPASILAQDTAPAAAETRYQFSYVGVGVNLGFGTDSALGDVSFAAYSKFALNPYFSFRPTVLISNNASFLLPVTYDFPIRGPGRGFVPYIGGGVLFSTGDDSNVDLLLSAGIDVPISSQLTATAGVNIGPFDGVDVGFLLGLAYNFSSTTVTVPPVSVGNIVNNAANAVGNAANSAANAVGDAANAVGNTVGDAANSAANAIDNALPADRRRFNPSYFGVGVNLGVTGPTALGDISFAVLSKIALSSSFSVRPAVLISNDATFLIPVTYDFPTFRTEFVSFAPYIGAGLALSTANDSSVDLLLSAGIDVPITREFAFTSSLNVSPLNNVDIGFLLGVVYTFGSF